MDDIAGMKLRLGSGVLGDVGAALGATGIRVPAPKVYETLASNSADGVIMPMETKKSFKLFEVVKHSYEVPGGFYRGSFAVVMNQETFDRLSDADRAALDGVFGETLSRVAGKAWDVIDAAATKPFGYMPFYPGPGLGGHCIPVDPFYLTAKAREYGLNTRFIELAGEMNDSMMDYTVNKVAEALNENGMAVKGTKLLVLGLAYKPDVDDMRESPSFGLMDRLKSRGATVDYYDPYIPIIGKTREHESWEGHQSVQWTEEQIRDFDAVLIATNHSSIDYSQLADWCDCIVDSRNAMKGIRVKDGQVTQS